MKRKIVTCQNMCNFHRINNICFEVAESPNITFPIKGSFEIYQHETVKYIMLIYYQFCVFLPKYKNLLLL